MSSVWTQRLNQPRFPSLEGDLNTDVLIIGGGIAGLLCAHRLRQAGADCVLLEAKELCSGVTGNTTAKITIQHGLIYDKLLHTFRVEKARLYLKANRRRWSNTAHCAEALTVILRSRTPMSIP